MSNYSHSQYLEYIIQPTELRKTVRRVSKKISALKASGLQFDAIAFTGNSGAGVGFPLAYLLGLPLICVRKFGQASHGQRIESTKKNYNNYLIVDDLISSGNTISRILDEIHDYERDKKANFGKCVGILLYSSGFSNQYYTRGSEIPLFHLRDYKGE